VCSSIRELVEKQGHLHLFDLYNRNVNFDELTHIFDSLKVLLNIVDSEKNYRSNLLMDLSNMDALKLEELKHHLQEHEPLWYKEMITCMLESKIEELHDNFLRRIDAKKEAIMDMIDNKLREGEPVYVDDIFEEMEMEKRSCLDNVLPVPSRTTLPQILSDKIDATKRATKTLLERKFDYYHYPFLPQCFLPPAYSPTASPAYSPASPAYSPSASPAYSPGAPYVLPIYTSVLKSLGSTLVGPSDNIQEQKLVQRKFEYFILSIVFNVNEGKNRWPGLFDLVRKHSTLRLMAAMDRKYNMVNVHKEWENAFIIDLEKNLPFQETISTVGTQREKKDTPPSQLKVEDWFPSWQKDHDQIDVYCGGSG
jgi:hypothetical protein